MNENELISYDESSSIACNGISRLTEIMRSPSSVAYMIGNIPSIAQGIKEIRLAQIESKRQLEALRLMSNHNLHKFDKIIKGAEMRLDRQLDEMKEIRTIMRRFNLASLSQTELSILNKLNEQINMINSNVMYELQMLYNL